MNYIVLLNSKKGEQFRFFNPVSEEEKNKFEKTEGVIFVTPEEMNIKELMSIPLANDGLIPLAFSLNMKISEKDLDEGKGNEIIACLLLATGFCNRCMKRRQSDTTKLSSVTERLDFLYDKCRRHFTTLELFKMLERLQNNPFEIDSSLIEMWEKLVEDANDIINLSKDIQLIIGEKVNLYE